MCVPSEDFYDGLDKIGNYSLGWYNTSTAARAVLSAWDGISFYTNATKRFTISADGNVMIGSNNADGFKLSVAGKIRAHEVKVYTGWADYVFADDYKLLSLEETEAYINENKHLPGIPSAQEIEKNEGIELGEMQKLQMAKIEELTLYMIAMKKELEQLKQENEALKAILSK